MARHDFSNMQNWSLSYSAIISVVIGGSASVATGAMVGWGAEQMVIGALVAATGHFAGVMLVKGIHKFWNSK